jgi:glycosyltransferase involved in cell wall biosynthesis
MSLRGRDIVCLSNHYWDERWFRKQEFMSRFARENRVLYVEPSFSMARGPEEHLSDVATNRFMRARLERHADGVTLLKPPRGLPKWSHPRVERLTYRWYGHVVGHAMRSLGMRDAILWIYRPSYWHGLAAIPYRHFVFDLTDDLAAYGRHEGGLPHVERFVTDLARRSDLLVVTATTLLERYGQLAKRAVQIPNGFDASRFDGSDELDPPSLLESVPRPIIGFVGTLFTFLDFELLERVALAHHDKSLVLVGPVETTAQRKVARLLRLPNVHHVDDQPQAAVPLFLAQFDVCLNAFLAGRAADSVIPLKVFEYLAAGKPVVSTPMRALEQEPAAEQICFAGTPEQFCAAVVRCVADSSAAARRARREAVADYCWERLFSRLDKTCEATLID